MEPSKPSTTPLDIADKHSVKLIADGVAPRQVIVLTNNGDSVERMIRPFKSAGFSTTLFVHTLLNPNE